MNTLAEKHDEFNRLRSRNSTTALLAMVRSHYARNGGHAFRSDRELFLHAYGDSHRTSEGAQEWLEGAYEEYLQSNKLPAEVLYCLL